jgi:hypothetical protein
MKYHSGNWSSRQFSQDIGFGPRTVDAQKPRLFPYHPEYRAKRSQLKLHRDTTCTVEPYLPYKGSRVQSNPKLRLDEGFLHADKARMRTYTPDGSNILSFSYQRELRE